MKKILIIFFTLHLSTLANAADIKTKYISSLSDYLENSLKGNFETVEAELSSGTSNEVVGSILVVTPLSEIENKNPVFFQGSVFFSDDSRETINLGIGKRQLLNNDNLILGTNLFYDHELEYNHQRASIGIEAISSVGSFRANQYYGLSGWKTGLNNIEEKPLDGNDFEIGAPLPYLPWTNVYFRSFKWEGASGAANQKGDEMSLEAKLPFGLNVEVGKRSHDGTTEDNEFMKLTWTCCNKNDDQEKFGISDKAYNLTSVADQRFVKVRRQNLIVKQKEMSLTVIGF
jgi:adhesin/invasin